MQQRTLENFDLGEGQVLLVDKPSTWSSFNTVNVIKRITKAKIGHAGTLDPLATGLLVLCTGKLTKSITQYIEDDKEYEATFYIGATTPSFDREQEVDQTWDITHITEEHIREAVKELTGNIEQIPPMYSAIKTKGVEAYHQARKGVDVVMEPRQVNISEFEITKIELPLVYCRIACSKGTYIRSIARDLGEKLGVGGYMHDLRRTRSGNFKLEDAWNLDDLCKYLIANKALILEHARSKQTLMDLPAFRNGILTIGTFDGVHHGHQEIIHRINELAKQHNGESIILTFHPHPRLVINPNDTTLKLINTLEEKIELMAKYSVDNLIVAPFNRDFSQLSARQYVEDFLWKNIKPKVVVIGYDHRFGNNREGGIELIKEMGKELGFEVEEIEKQTIDHIDVSSTKVRNALLAGDIEQATILLGHMFTFEGVVVKGAQRGRDLGYPTANIHVENPNKLIPEKGIYAVKVWQAGMEFSGMMSIGYNPTFDGQEKTIEVNIFDFKREIYGEKIKVGFVAKLRDEAKFESIQALIDQIAQDEINSRKILNQAS